MKVFDERKGKDRAEDVTGGSPEEGGGGGYGIPKRIYYISSF